MSMASWRTVTVGLVDPLFAARSCSPPVPPRDAVDPDAATFFVVNFGDVTFGFELRRYGFPADAFPFSLAVEGRRGDRGDWVEEEGAIA